MDSRRGYGSSWKQNRGKWDGFEKNIVEKHLLITVGVCGGGKGEVEMERPSGER